MRTVGTNVLEPRGDEAPLGAPRRPWNLPTRIAFRFVFAYLLLFCVSFAQILFAFTGIVGKWLSESAILWQMRAANPLTGWVGEHVFGVEAVLHENSGSGDQAAIWVLIFCELVAAAVITVAWSIFDRRRREYTTLGGWFVLFIRLCLGGQMLFYGLAKAIPAQMPAPSLTALLQPYGTMSPASVLWNQVGAAPAYEILLGTAETLGGLLLFVPRTATIGAMLSLVSMAQVFVLNMTYDVPVKILSFHLLLLCLAVLAPQARRLANVLVLERPSEPATQPVLFGSRRANRIAAALQVALGLWILTGTTVLTWEVWRDDSDGAPKPPLYGIWTVGEFTRAGHPAPPLLTDESRWRRVIFDRQNTAVQKMDDSSVPVVAQVDEAAHTLVLSEPPRAQDAPPARLASFTFAQPTSDTLLLTGELNGTPVTLSLDRVDLNTFTLRSRGFHWVQEYPYFR
ncbi:DoxX family protein [Nocardia sp. NBC_00508]|uniref:DoxX family protein n=1 Tax=Nocardia sp. NBC_00508 TaxID=2975992 RepID=UPI002E821CDF|nr:DoxX family protein [Nocardia sp. NBC_00508]WUD65075.1 DoxX family protein [Nocardia sp. NBC_00508]